jgi:hypothetical protein
MTTASAGMGIVAFLPRSSSGLLLLERDPEVMAVFIMVQSLSLCLIVYEWFDQVTSRSFSKWSFNYRAWRLKLRLVAAICSSLEAQAFSSSPSSLAITAMRRGHRFYPFLPPLAPFLAPLMVALGSCARLPPVAAYALPRTKAALTTSSLKACQVVALSSSLVVFG